MLSDQTIDELNALPLEEVMRNNGYLPGLRIGDKYLKYCCPFHTERDPSFRVDLRPSGGKTYAGFHCYVCGESNGNKGVGAIMLQQLLLKQSGQPYEYMDAVKRLARDFNIVVEGEYYNGFLHRSRITDPLDEIRLNKKPGAFSPQELRALGCQVEQVMENVWLDDGTQERRAVLDAYGKPVFKYSWGTDFYRKSCQGNNFDSRVLNERFNLYSLSSYISVKKEEGKGDKRRLCSRVVEATDAYPMFAFFYEDEQGWWAKKYEPLYRQTKKTDGTLTQNVKFTYWYQGNRKRPDLQNFIYGDADVMRALKNFDENADVTQNDDTRADLVEITYKKKIDKENVVNASRKVFSKLIICSGPRDAINTYYHSDVHVCWPHSEMTDIPLSTMKRLLAIAKTVYVMYDIDKVGTEAMNRLAMKYIDLRVIYLPDYLKNYTDRRTGRPCKDAEEYFNYYRPKEDDNRFEGSVNEHFRSLMRDAKTMKFWDEEYGRKSNADGDKVMKCKYTINFVNLSQFLCANGFYKYIDEAKETRFVYVKDNIVEVLRDDDILTRIKGLMKSYLFINDHYNNDEISNAISVQKKVDKSTLLEIKPIELNFMSWGKDYEYFFFRNCAVRVTKDEIIPQRYADIPCHVNRDAILPWNFTLSRTPLFDIKLNPEYVIRKNQYEAQMMDKRMDAETKERLSIEFNSYERLWKYKLSFPKDIGEMPVPLQFVYDTGRIYWKKEEDGLPLSVEERQRQDMQFINKAGGIGYGLSRYRTNSRQLMTCFTDFKVIDERKSSGGTGKSMYQLMLETVRSINYKPGNEFRTKPGEMSLNFTRFRDTIDSNVFIDDLRKDIRGDEFKNITANMTTRSLYQNEILLPKERTPKLFITMNGNFDLSDPAIYRRCYLLPVSDYYHPTNYTGTVKERTPLTKFGKDIVIEASEEERQAIMNMLLQFCQFYIRTQEVIRPPVEKDGVQRYLYSAIREEFFIEWANGYFSTTWHFERPIHYKEMIIDYLEKRGDDVTDELINKTRGDFKKYLKLYCDSSQISINPQVVYEPRRATSARESLVDGMPEEKQLVADSKEGYVREKAWTTVFDGKKPRVPRERIVAWGRCYYFYKFGSEPRERKEVLLCTDRDLDFESEVGEEE